MQDVGPLTRWLHTVGTNPGWALEGSHGPAVKCFTKVGRAHGFGRQWGRQALAPPQACSSAGARHPNSWAPAPRELVECREDWTGLQVRRSECGMYVFEHDCGLHGSSPGQLLKWAVAPPGGAPTSHLVVFPPQHWGVAGGAVRERHWAMLVSRPQLVTPGGRTVFGSVSPKEQQPMCPTSS